jgi:hypothetical protein
MKPRRAMRVNSISSQFGQVFLALLIHLPRRFTGGQLLWPENPEYQDLSGAECIPAS